MYYAIVFLPLLGAILGGLISLAGAIGRFPGQGPERGLEEGATAHATHHHHAPSVHGDAGVIDHSHTEAHEHEPAAAGSRLTELITTTLLMVSMVLSWIAFVDV